MPIKIVSVYAASDGTTYPTEPEAKAHEVAALAEQNAEFQNKLHVFMVEHGVSVLAILSAKPDAPPKRKPRSDKGRNHKRKEKFCHGAAVAAENEEAA